jgi:hypothetical protein
VRRFSIKRLDRGQRRGGLLSAQPCGPSWCRRKDRNPPVRPIQIQRRDRPQSTQSGPTTDTASRLALVQTPPGLPGLQADFGHRFRKAQPLDWIEANGVSTLRRCSNTATHEARFRDVLSCQFGAASRVHSSSVARQAATASSRRAVPLSRAPRALCRDYFASTTGMRQSSIRE